MGNTSLGCSPNKSPRFAGRTRNLALGSRTLATPRFPAERTTGYYIIGTVQKDDSLGRDHSKTVRLVRWDRLKATDTSTLDKLRTSSYDIFRRNQAFL